MNFKISRLSAGISSLVIGGTPVTLDNERVGTVRVLPGPPPGVDVQSYDENDRFLRLTFGNLTLKSGEVVAVVLKSLGGKSVPSRSGKEDKIWRDVSHRNVLPLLGEVLFSSGPGQRSIKHLVSPVLCNGNFVHYLSQNPSEYSEKRLNDFIAQMLAGIVHLHGRNYSHGDFKLDNVLINDSREAVICDFGLSTEIVRGTNHLPTTPYVRSLGPKRYHSAEILNLGVKMLNATVLLAPHRPTTPPAFSESPPRKSPESDMWAFGMAILHLYLQETA
ncbi:kinase-like protein [Auricularia subglabra TFB-10046 SS5]|uniref:Kinase-like protein n=1 Tax=Auricularia subglabra (strain TFB-10046 / SS5) TaxID=717982 RepID=J0L840_AURST|nr:kinase-like protein [Auricularia subglabra TFB-10046 SS5]